MRAYEMYCEDCRCTVFVTHEGFDRLVGVDADDQRHLDLDHDLSGSWM